MKSLSRVWLFTILWTVACQAPPSMEFSRQGYWSGLLFPSPGDVPNPGIEPGSPALQVDSLPSEPQGSSVVGETYSNYGRSRGSRQAPDFRVLMIGARCGGHESISEVGGWDWQGAVEGRHSLKLGWSLRSGWKHEKKLVYAQLRALLDKERQRTF